MQLTLNAFKHGRALVAVVEHRCDRFKFKH